ncbi:P-loop NTPase fold protein [Pseudomonas moraviensis]|nr:P-loop NTPase fold protein [Pseudomonas moraviensis]
MDQNIGTKEALTRYVNFVQPPYYAILLTGAWGAGKTFFIKKFLKEVFPAEKKYIYVSLYGVANARDIHAAIFRESYPALSGKAAKLVGGLSKSILSFWQVSNDLKMEDLIKVPSPDLYIFDDMERCQMAHEEVLGYINEFVEHEGAKVILIANEAEINEGTDYKRKREKLIGKTFEVFPDFNGAIDTFYSGIGSDSTREMLKSNKLEIQRIYRLSELNNLRILQQALWDFELVYEAIAEEHKKNDSAMVQLLQLILSFSFEIRSGRLDRSDLLMLPGLMLGEDNWINEGESNPFERIKNSIARYEHLVAGDLLSANTLVDVLVSGMIDKKIIRSNLDNSPLFARITEKSWRLVWHASQIDDEKFFEALRDMDERFDLRKYHDVPEMLHVFALKLWLSREGIIETTIENVVIEIKNYVTDIYSDFLAPLYKSKDFYAYNESSDGLGYIGRDTPEFLEVSQFLSEQRLRKGIDCYPEFAGKAIALLENNLRGFHELLTGDTEDIPYSKIPFLQALDCIKFVDHLVAVNPRNQDQVCTSICLRYRQRRLSQKLSEETEWFIGIIKELQSRLAIATALQRVRLKRLLYGYFKPTLEDYPELKDRIVFEKESEE